MSEKQTLEKRIGEGKPGPGRKKGVPNRTTTMLKDAILQAATEAGGPEGLVGYLKFLAADSPPAFASLLGKVLPMQINHGDVDGENLRPTVIQLVAPSMSEK